MNTSTTVSFVFMDQPLIGLFMDEEDGQPPLLTQLSTNEEGEGVFLTVDVSVSLAV